MQQNILSFECAPLASVKITDQRCKRAFQKEKEYLLSLSVERLTAGFMENAGIQPPCSRYGGWESGLIGGHTLGHYLTALSQAYASETNADEKSRLLSRVTQTVEILKNCQDETTSGFLWGAPMAKAGYPEAQFDNVEQGKTDIKKQAWVPWYTMHKIISGLLDAYLLAESDMALFVARRLGDWICGRVFNWSEKTRKKVLKTEYGGMNDCLYTLYSLTGEEQYLQAAHAFDEESLFSLILTEGKDVLKDKHANTMIPKIIGALNRYLTLHGKTINGKKRDEGRYLRVAESFWKIVVERHTYATGGNSEWEHFGADYVLDKRRTNCTCETCNTYNMLKLTRSLFCVTGEKKYADYYDLTFTNAILGSQNHKTGMTTYFQPLASGYFKVFSTPYDKFWCCTGTGMENFTKLGDGIYYFAKDMVLIERYLSSVYSRGKTKIKVTCDFPLSDTARIQIVNAAATFALLLRVPDWAAGECILCKNSQKIVYREIKGHALVEANEGDVFEWKIPVTVTLKGLPDGDALAFYYGGSLLCAKLGKSDMQESATGVDVTVPKRRVIQTERVYFENLASVLKNPENYLVRKGDAFELQGGDITLSFDFYNKVDSERYAVYLKLREGKRENDGAEWKDEREPFDSVQPGYGQYETDELHEMREEKTAIGFGGESYRYALSGGKFSYDFAVDVKKKNVISLCFSAKDVGKTLKITAEDKVIYEGWVQYAGGEEKFNREFEIPPTVISSMARQKSANGTNYMVIRIAFEGIGRRASIKIRDKISIFCE